MSNLEQLILEIEKISGELEPPGSLRNEYLLSVNEYISNFINDIKSAAAYSDKTHMIEFKRKHVMNIIFNHVRQAIIPLKSKLYYDEKINREILSLSGVKRSLSDLLKT